MELKHILARQPGPEAAEQLQIYRHTLREKTKQLKVSGSLSAFLARGRSPAGDPTSPQYKEPSSQMPHSTEVGLFFFFFFF